MHHPGERRQTYVLEVAHGRNQAPDFIDVDDVVGWPVQRHRHGSSPKIA
jgi:hypothetical protein